MNWEERPYQQEAIAACDAAFAAGKTSVMLESPVGSGKTYMALETVRLLEARAVRLGRDRADARRRAARDAVVVAVAVRLRVRRGGVALAQPPVPLQEVAHQVHDGRRRERAEVLVAVVLHDAALREAGARQMALRAQRQVALVVAQGDVEARAVVLDEPPLGEQRLGPVADLDPLQVGDAVHEPAQLGRAAPQGGLAEVALHAAPEVHRLADVDDLPVPVAVQVAPRPLRKGPELLAQPLVHRNHEQQSTPSPPENQPAARRTKSAEALPLSARLC